MAMGADWQPITDAASLLTRHSEHQNQLVRGVFGELDDIRSALEVRFRELEQWHQRLVRREHAMEARQISCDHLLAELTNEIRTLKARMSQQQ